MDEDKLADAYNEALALEKAGNFDAAAILYKEALAIDPDDHAGASVRLASMGKSESPKRAPSAYVATLFDQHAEVFDKILVDDLGYDVPKLSNTLLAKHGLTEFDRVLDLGCGTGLMGVELEGRTKDLIGVDLSENMVEIAYDREIYDTLYVADAEDYLEEADEGPWDLICATDVLPYLGEIEAFFSKISKNLTANGYVVFSTETLIKSEFNDQGYKVGAHQRFAHDPDYIKQILAKNNIDMLAIDDITVRLEQRAPIAGHLILAKNQSKT